MARGIQNLGANGKATPYTVRTGMVQAGQSYNPPPIPYRSATPTRGLKGVKRYAGIGAGVGAWR